MIYDNKPEPKTFVNSKSKTYINTRTGVNDHWMHYDIDDPEYGRSYGGWFEENKPWLVNKNNGTYMYDVIDDDGKRWTDDNATSLPQEVTNTLYNQWNRRQLKDNTYNILDELYKNPSYLKETLDKLKSPKFANGGTFENPLLTPAQLDIIYRVNNSNKNFANRLLNPNRAHIQDWETKNKIATHKLSVGSDDYGYFIYPEVQEINGELIDFTRPPYHSFAGQDSAVENNDFIRVNSLDDGLWFTRNYKHFYPSFKR